MIRWSIVLLLASVLIVLCSARAIAAADDRPRLLVLTDIGGDPDGDKLSFHWYVYPGPGAYGRSVPIDSPAAETVTLNVPTDAAGTTIHVILEVTDSGEPALTRYRRAILHVQGKQIIGHGETASHRGVYAIALRAEEDYGNPYFDAALRVEFTRPDTRAQACGPPSSPSPAKVPGN